MYICTIPEKKNLIERELSFECGYFGATTWRTIDGVSLSLYILLA